MAGTTPVILHKGYIDADGEFHLPISTDEFVLHHHRFSWMMTTNHEWSIPVKLLSTHEKWGRGDLKSLEEETTK